MKKQEIDNFDPLKIVEDSINSGFDPALAHEIDERDLNWCPNIWSWIVDADYLNITTIYPTQIHELLRLFGDVCPWCSDWEFYKKDFDVLEKLGNIQDRIQLLQFGKCPKCGKTRLDAYNDGFWTFPNELDLLWGMRCTSATSRIYSEKGIIQLKDVIEGDILSHGEATKKFDCGTLPSLKITTDFNWTLVGAKETHIVPVLNNALDLEFKYIKDCTTNDYLVLQSPNLWSKEIFRFPEFIKDYHHVAKRFPFPNEVTPELARFIGYLISNGNYTAQNTITISSSSPETDKDIKQLILGLFGEEPKLEHYKNTSSCVKWAISGRAILEWLAFIGLKMTTAHFKEIPDFILQSPKEIVCECLAGLFEGDGGIHVEKVDHRRKVKLYYTSVSKVLIDQMRLILLNLGIVTRCSKFISNGYGKANTYVRDFDAPEDQDKTYSYILSTKCSKYIEIFMKNVRLVSQDKLDALEFVNPKGRIRYLTPIGQFQEGTKRFPSKLKPLIDKGYFFVKITKIEEGEALPMMDVHVPETNLFTADGFVHHNSGKSAIVGILASYQLHRFLKIPDPAAYYNLLKGSLLVMRFIALTAGQASESIWHQFTRSITTCAWFAQYHDFLAHHEKKLGIELNKWLTQSFGYVHKKITGYYLGASIDTSRGRTAVGSYFDEIGWWLGSEQAKRANAHETYQAYQKASLTIRNAAATRFNRGFYDTPTALIAAVSSTSSKTDYIMYLLRQAKKDDKRVASHKASWEVNPEFALNPDELQAEKNANYKTYLRDYASIPPFASDPFFDNEDLVFKQIKIPQPNWPIMIEQGDVGLFLNAEKVEKNASIPYCLAIDLGHNNCGYAAALLKLKETDFSVIQIAGLFAIYPNKERGEVNDLSKCFTHFIKHLCKVLPIRLVVYDQWQSKTQIQDLMNMKIKAEQYSMTYDNFLYFRNQVLQGKLEIPETEIPIQEIDNCPEELTTILHSKPYLHFLWQLLSVTEIGKKIGKGDGHDDLFRAVSLGCKFLWDEDLRKHFEYKHGMLLSPNQLGKGRLVVSAGFKSGYSSNIQNNINVFSSDAKRPLGAIITRNSAR